jgi:hypothetical protein
MSLELAAQHLASRGRKGDSMLVHMAPEEVSGLQALARAAGGTLTLNPDTGLPEANFLKRMLPMIIGAGLAAATGGTSLALTPGMIGLGLGGFETLRTGSLEKGLMAGLGAYGGAGLAGSLMGAGTGALSSTAGATGANSVVPAVADAGVQSAIPELASQGAGVTVTPLGAEAANLSQTGSNLFGGQSYFGPGQGAEAMTVGSPIPAANVLPTTPIPTTPYPTALSQNAADIGNAYAQEQAAQNAVANRLATATPTDTLQAGLGQISKNPSQLMTKDNLKYGLAALGSTLQSPKQTPYAGSGPNPYEFEYDPNNQMYTRVPVGTRQRDILAPTTRMAADGGMMNSGPIEAMSDRNQMQTMMANGGQMFAAGGQSHLGDYSDGGRLLKGPGDGVSDSIPATIADKRPARLADGEFVVPARIVSELGNGSTEAGARKLYAMMARVQKARGKTTGKDRVAVNSRAEKLLPA